MILFRDELYLKKNSFNWERTSSSSRNHRKSIKALKELDYKDYLLIQKKGVGETNTLQQFS